MITISDVVLLLRFVSLVVGETFTTHTQFYQWPLYVAGFSDIHQSLEAGLARGDIETNNTDQTSNQEVRYTNTYTKAYVLLIQMRSEEHTSELQSHVRISYAVFCLKKKKTK